MRLTPLVLAFSLAAAASAGAGEPSSLEIAPLGAKSVELGGFRGVAYYTQEPHGFRVVATLAAGQDGAPLRFVATLADRQKVTFSVPAPDGKARETVEFARDGDRLIVSRPDLAGF